MSWQSLQVENEAYCELCLHYNLSAIPAFYIFNRNKCLVKIIQGDDLALLKQTLAELKNK